MFVIVAKLVPLLHNYSKKKNKEGEVSVRHLVLSSYLQSCSSVIWNTKVNG